MKKAKNPSYMYEIIMNCEYYKTPVARFGFIKAKSPEKALKKFEKGLGDTPHLRVFRCFRRQYVATLTLFKIDSVNRGLKPHGGR